MHTAINSTLEFASRKTRLSLYLVLSLVLFLLFCQSLEYIFRSLYHTQSIFRLNTLHGELPGFVELSPLWWECNSVIEETRWLMDVQFCWPCPERCAKMTVGCCESSPTLWPSCQVSIKFSVIALNNCRQPWLRGLFIYQIYYNWTIYFVCFRCLYLLTREWNLYG